MLKTNILEWCINIVSRVLRWELYWIAEWWHPILKLEEGYSIKNPGRQTQRVNKRCKEMSKYFGYNNLCMLNENFCLLLLLIQMYLIYLNVFWIWLIIWHNFHWIDPVSGERAWNRNVIEKTKKKNPVFILSSMYIWEAESTQTHTHTHNKNKHMFVGNSNTNIYQTLHKNLGAAEMHKYTICVLFNIHS